jgi:hypothetical protein
LDNVFLHGRICKFIYEEAPLFIKSISEEEFERHRSSLSFLLLEKKRKLTQETAKYWDAILRGNFDFNRSFTMNSLLSDIKRSDLLNFYTHTISGDPSLAINCLAIHICSDPSDIKKEESSSESGSDRDFTSGTDTETEISSSFSELDNPAVLISNSDSTISDNGNISGYDYDSTYQNWYIFTLNTLGLWKSCRKLLPLPSPATQLTPKYSKIN